MEAERMKKLKVEQMMELGKEGGSNDTNENRIFPFRVECRHHNNYFPRMQPLSEILGVLTLTDCGQAPLRGPAIVIPPALPEDTYVRLA